MAQPISLEQPTANHRNTNGDLERPDAALSTHELIQSLQDHGILDLLRGMVGASDQLVGKLTATAKTAEGTRALRNFILLTNSA